MTFNLEPKFLSSQCYASNRKVIESYALFVSMNLSSLFALITKLHKRMSQGGVKVDGPKICPRSVFSVYFDPKRPPSLDLIL